ncbi:MAG: hypothetical protein IJT97_09845 [Bacteroidaceae bacterium]|nr:hypothetical protein [Bacteroidaceae bacterium]
MSTVALNNLWDYLQSLALSNSNKDWLANKLIESKVEDIDEEARREEMLYSMFGAWSKCADAELQDTEWLDEICGGWNEDPRSTEEIKADIRNAHQSGITRKIRAF